jgi:hypothetical protein
MPHDGHSAEDLLVLQRMLCQLSSFEPSSLHTANCCFCSSVHATVVYSCAMPFHITATNAVQRVVASTARLWLGIWKCQNAECGTAHGAAGMDGGGSLGEGVVAPFDLECVERGTGFSSACQAASTGRNAEQHSNALSRLTRTLCSGSLVP